MLLGILITLAAMLGGWLISLADDALRFRTLRRLLSRRRGLSSGPRGGARVALPLMRRLVGGRRLRLGVVGGREEAQSLKDGRQTLGVALTFGRKG